MVFSVNCLLNLSYLSLTNFISLNVSYLEALCPVSIKPTLWILEICVLWLGIPQAWLYVL